MAGVVEFAYSLLQDEAEQHPEKVSDGGTIIELLGKGGIGIPLSRGSLRRLNRLRIGSAGLLHSSTSTFLVDRLQLPSP